HLQRLLVGVTPQVVELVEDRHLAVVDPGAIGGVVDRLRHPPQRLLHPLAHLLKVSLWIDSIRPFHERLLRAPGPATAPVSTPHPASAYPRPGKTGRPSVDPRSAGAPYRAARGGRIFVRCMLHYFKFRQELFDPEPGREVYRKPGPG